MLDNEHHQRQKDELQALQSIFSGGEIISSTVENCWKVFSSPYFIKKYLTFSNVRHSVWFFIFFRFLMAFFRIQSAFGTHRTGVRVD
jgi:hypothetical protein